MDRECVSDTVAFLIRACLECQPFSLCRSIPVVSSTPHDNRFGCFWSPVVAFLAYLPYYGYCSHLLGWDPKQFFN